ncbi:DUF5047 domain-containing protein [Catenulispora pinisilvae]|uniref:DUF5047 domain-containing protein n=1 Tax=Catenulispora pinisilvae TaxID=2705253 RepID=UPI001891F87A|nr:DUF5047 domain-containing protein [Catenulispora pinisilvae]
MRQTSAAWRYALTASHGVALRVDSWRGGKLLASRVPVVAGSVTFDDTATLRRQLSLTVPLVDMDGTRWDPRDDPAHPLAFYGQRLNIWAGILNPTGTTEVLNQGWYLIDQWELNDSDQTVSVTGVDLMQLIADNRQDFPDSPPSGATYGSELIRQADGILPVWIHPDVADAPINTATVWDRDRTKNLADLARAWGVRIVVDDDGRLAALPPYPAVADTPPVVRLQGGYSGTLTDRNRSGTRERLFNAVTVTGKAPEDESAAGPSGTAEITDPTSPIRVDGPFGRRVRYYASDLLTTDQQCADTAAAMLRRYSGLSRAETIKAVPDPSLELGDVAQVVTGGNPWTGRIQALTLPLLASDSMEVAISTTPPDNDDGGS